MSVNAEQVSPVEIEQQGPQVLSGRVKVRQGSKVIATLEPTGRFRGSVGMGSVSARGIKLKSSTVGRVEGQKIRSKQGKTVARLEGEVLRSNTGKRIATIDSKGVIRAGNGKRLGQIEGASESDMPLIAGFLCLVASVESW